MVHQDIRIVIVHSHRLFRETLAMTLSQQEGIVVSGEVSGLDQIYANGAESQCDIILVEAIAPLCRCYEQVRGLQPIMPACRAIIRGGPACLDSLFQFLSGASRCSAYAAVRRAGRLSKYTPSGV